MTSCNRIIKPDFTKEQIEECSKCKHASAKVLWCGLFGVWIQEHGIIIVPDKKIIVPGDNRRTRHGRSGSRAEGCCGEKIEKLIVAAEKEIGPADSTIDKLTDIAVGNLTHIIEEIFKISILKCPATDSRIEKCLVCEKNTWLTKYEFVRFVLKYGREFLKNIKDLTKLPPLPKKEKRKGTGLFCQLCKCFIPAKARREDQECTLGKWNNMLIDGLSTAL